MTLRGLGDDTAVTTVGANKRDLLALAGRACSQGAGEGIARARSRAP